VRVAVVLTALLLLAAPARAEVRLVDVGTGAVTGPVHDGSVLAWTDAGLFVTEGSRVWRVVDGVGTLQPQYEGAVSIGPRGHAVFGDLGAFEVRDAAGKVVTRRRVPVRLYGPAVSWRDDRVAVLAGDRLHVVDLATGKLIGTRDDVDSLTSQGFAPDDVSVVVTAGREVLSFPDGRVLHRTEHKFDAVGTVASNGTVAITHDTAIRVLGNSGIHVEARRPALWDPAGTMLAYRLIRYPDVCSYGQLGLGVAALGEKPRVLIPPSPREIGDHVWSPDGRTIAVDLGPEVPEPVERRGKRHPWPKRIARDYHMSTARGNAALQRIVVRAARALRRGDGREETLRRVRIAYAKVDDEAGDTIVREAVANELDKWLHAAGWDRIEAFDEITC
jgi:hypothetical protein